MVGSCVICGTSGAMTLAVESYEVFPVSEDATLAVVQCGTCPTSEIVGVDWRHSLDLGAEGRTLCS